MESLIIQLIGAGVGTLGFAMLYNVRGKKLFWATFGGFLGWAFYDFLHLFTDSNYLSCFGAAMLLHIYAEWMARRQKTPATVFFVAAAIPLIPGGPLYRMMSAAMEQEWKEFVDQGVSALLYALGIAGGILCAAALMSLFRQTAVYHSTAEKLAEIGTKKEDKSHSP